MFRNPLTDTIGVLVVLLLFFGPKRLPLLGKSLGQGMREFKDSITGHSGSADEDEQASLNETVPAAAAAPAPQAPPPPPADAVPPSETPAAPASEPEPAPVVSSEHRS